MKRTDFLLHLISEIAHYVLDSDPTRMVISVHQETDGLHLGVFDTTERDEQELEAARRGLTSSAGRSRPPP